MQLFIWIAAAFFIACWSLLAWGAATLAALGAGVGGLPADWYAWLSDLPGIAWLDVWMPGWREALVWSAQTAGAVLGWVGETGRWVIWIVWGLGTAAMLLCAALVSGLVALMRRDERRRGAAVQSA
jgi:hypothetical protein